MCKDAATECLSVCLGEKESSGRGEICPAGRDADKEEEKRGGDRAGEVRA